MAYRRLARDKEEEGGELSDGQLEAAEEAQSASAEATEVTDLATLHRLLEKAMKAQESQAFKQEQRWRSVQMQLNQLREDVDAERTPSASPPGAAPAAATTTTTAPAESASWTAATAATTSSAAAAALLPQHSALAPGPAGTAPPVAWSRAAIPKLVEGDDIEHYLLTFERLATAYRWPKEDWAVFLVPYLTGKARSAYVAMDMDQAMDYDRVKEAILNKYEINEEVYRRRFREPDVRPTETPRELYTRLKDQFLKWIRPANKSVEEVSEMLILEQFLRTLAPDIRVWVKEHKPQNGQRAAELVENFLAARRGLKSFRLETQARPAVRGRSEGFNQGSGTRTGEPRMPARTSFPPAKPKDAQEQRTSGPVICYHCGQEGHIKPDCPNRKPKHSGRSCIPRPEEGDTGFMSRLQTTPVLVNGVSTTALLDSGSTQTLVQPHLVEKRNCIQGRKLNILCVNGDEHVYPVAEVYLDIRGQTYQMTVGVVEKLSHPVVLGQDILVLPELLQTCKPVSMVVTRSQSKAQAPGEEFRELAESSSWSELPFADGEVTPPAKVRARKTRRQRRQARLLGTGEKQEELILAQPGDDWDKVPDNIEQLQREDPTLLKAYSQVTHIDDVPTGVTPTLSGESYRERG